MSRILLADDHDLVRDTISAYLSAQGNLTITKVSTLDQALQAIAQDGPFDLVLLDYTMPGMNALQGLRDVLAVAGCPVALLSGTATPGVARRAFDAGAMGFLPKTLAPETLVTAVRHLMQGGRYVPRDFMAQSDAAPGPVGLTPRETDVLRGLCEGKSNKEIARDLSIQEVTVKLHVKTLCRKLEARNRTHAAMLGRDLLLP